MSGAVQHFDADSPVYGFILTWRSDTWMNETKENACDLKPTQTLTCSHQPAEGCTTKQVQHSKFNAAAYF